MQPHLDRPTMVLVFGVDLDAVDIPRDVKPRAMDLLSDMGIYSYGRETSSGVLGIIVEVTRAGDTLTRERSDRLKTMIFEASTAWEQAVSQPRMPETAAKVMRNWFPHPTSTGQGPRLVGTYMMIAESEIPDRFASEDFSEEDAPARPENAWVFQEPPRATTPKEAPAPNDAELLLLALSAVEVYPEQTGCAFGWLPGYDIAYVDEEGHVSVYRRIAGVDPAAPSGS